MYIKSLSVTEVNNYLKKLTDSDFILSNLSVKGEISNFKLHSSGHLYFSLKDENSKINCVMFRSDAVNLNFIPENGMKVTIKARLSIYVKDGSYQLYCRNIEQDGLGSLFVQYEKLKEKLQKLGLFNEENKKAIPKYVNRIGVITSETGAAIQDIIKVIRRRNSLVDIVLYPSLVQGEEAVPNLIRGLKYFNEKNSVDVIIIGRGGGSIEELWAFNNEELAYAIFNSKIPVISAVGHEVDFTICDFVSDMRAATPSAAAEIVAANLEELEKNLEFYNQALNNSIQRLFHSHKNKLELMLKSLEFNSPSKLIAHEYERIDNLKDNLKKLVINKLDKNKVKLQNFNALLKAYNPLNVLDKGYSIVQNEKGMIIKTINDVEMDEELQINVKDGKINVYVKSKE
jgi:exodeoxyribonuclease VII large subunit